MQFTSQERVFLQRLGRSEEGRDLSIILERAKAHYSSIAGIDGSKDYGAQVEGRRLFVEFVDDLVKEIMTRKRNVVPREPLDMS